MIWVVTSAKMLLKLYREVLLFSIGAVYGLQECSLSLNLIVAVPRCSWGNRKGQHPESAGPSSFSTSRQSVSKSVYRIGSASLIYLPCHKTALLGLALPHSGKRRPGGTGGQPVLRRIMAVGRPVPFAALVLFARSRGGSHSAPAAWLPAPCSGPPAVPLWREKTSSHIPPEKRGQMEMLITDFFSNIFSWPQFRTKQNDGRRFYPRLQSGQSPGSFCRG